MENGEIERTLLVYSAMCLATSFLFFLYEKCPLLRPSSMYIEGDLGWRGR